MISSNRFSFHKIIIFLLEHSKIRQFSRTFNPNLDKLHFCETGFNIGHSALFWLLYDNRIHVVSFDIDSSEYTLAARKFLEIHFPNRFNLILGNSTSTLPYLCTNIHQFNVTYGLLMVEVRTQKEYLIYQMQFLCWIII